MDIGHMSYAEQKALHSEFLSVNAGALRSGFWFWKAEHFWRFVELVPVEDIPRVLVMGEMPREWHPGDPLSIQGPIIFSTKGDQFRSALEFILQRLCHE